MNFREFLNENKQKDLEILVNKIANNGDLDELVRNLILSNPSDKEYSNTDTDTAIEDLVKYFKSADAAYKAVNDFNKRVIKVK